MSNKYKTSNKRIKHLTSFNSITPGTKLTIRKDIAKNESYKSLRWSTMGGQEVTVDECINNTVRLVGYPWLWEPEMFSNRLPERYYISNAALITKVFENPIVCFRWKQQILSWVMNWGDCHSFTEEQILLALEEANDDQVELIYELFPTFRKEELPEVEQLIWGWDENENYKQKLEAL